MSAELPPPDKLIEQLLNGMVKLAASDLHVKVGYIPTYRIAGHLKHLQLPPIPDTEYVEKMMLPLLPEKRHVEYTEHGNVDFSCTGTTGDRYRVNIFRSGSEMNAAVRRVQSQIPSFKDLNMPPVYDKICKIAYDGLVLVSGVTGSGKSSTLAAMLDQVNHTRSAHVVTIEDPVEYRFIPDKCIISQREIGIDVDSFHTALRSVVRQDPDVILIGEMRDRDTMMAALQAAETGHLVFGTLHCSDAQQSFARILEFFPRNEHAFIRSSIANSLRAICCQRLLPGVAEGSRVPATEVLLTNSIVRDRILTERDKDIPAIINQSTEEGMRSFTYSLAQLIENEMTHYDTAMEYAPNREALASMVKGIQTSGRGLV